MSNSNQNIISAIGECRTQREALYKIADLKDGLVIIKEAAYLIKSAGLSNAKLTSISSTAHNVLSISDDWEYVEPGVYKLINPNKYKKETI